MSDNTQMPTSNVAPTPEQVLENVQQIRDLFARAHDYLAQATFPGHMGIKVAEVLNFLKFQHDDFKRRGDEHAAKIEASKKAALSVVDTDAAQKAVDATLTPEAK